MIEFVRWSVMKRGAPACPTTVSAAAPVLAPAAPRPRVRRLVRGAAGVFPRAVAAGSEKISRSCAVSPAASAYSIGSTLICSW